MQCNIDAKGKAVRMISGIVVTILSVIVLVLCAFAVLESWIACAIGGLLLACGVFQIFEAKAGWCIVRAMGFKTPV